MDRHIFIFLVFSCLSLPTSRVKAATPKKPAAKVWVERLAQQARRDYRLAGRLLVKALGSPKWGRRWQALRAYMQQKGVRAKSLQNAMWSGLMNNPKWGAVVTKRMLQMLQDPHQKLKELMAKVFVVRRMHWGWHTLPTSARQWLQANRAFLLQQYLAPRLRSTKQQCQAIGVTPTNFQSKWPALLAFLRKRSKQRNLWDRDRRLSRTVECLALFPSKRKFVMPLMLVMLKRWDRLPRKIADAGHALQRALILHSPAGADAIAKVLLQFGRVSRVIRWRLSLALEQMPLLSSSTRKALWQVFLRESDQICKLRIAQILWSAGMGIDRIGRHLFGTRVSLKQKLYRASLLHPSVVRRYRRYSTNRAWTRFRRGFLSALEAGLRSTPANQIVAANILSGLFHERHGRVALLRASPKLLRLLLRLAKAKATTLREASLLAIGRMGVYAKGKGFCPGQREPERCILPVLLWGLNEAALRVQTAALVSLSLLGVRAKVALPLLCDILLGKTQEIFILSTQQQELLQKIRVVRTIMAIGIANKMVLNTLLRVRYNALTHRKLRFALDGALKDLKAQR